MKRYQKANEGIQAPEELKERAARPAGKSSYTRWAGAVAAVLAVAILGGAALWPGRANQPAALSEDGPGPRIAVLPDTYRSCALSLAAYPEMHSYPRQDDFYSGENVDWEKANSAYNDAYDAWRKDMTALRTNADYTGLLDGFISRSTAQFLTGAGEENRVYSPLNVYMALAMLAETAGDSSRAQLLDLLQVDSIEALRTRAAALWRDHYRDDGVVTSILGSSLWLREDFTYSQEVMDTLAADYYASSFSGKMGSEAYNQALRDWLNAQTGGLLAEQAAGLEMSPDTVLALASTIYFKAAWNSEFNKERTETDRFHALAGDVDADFMHKTLEDTYYWGDRFAAVQLHFRQGGSLWLILPDEGVSVDELLQSGEAMEFLLADKCGQWDETAQKTTGAWPGQKHLQINLSMPRFDVSSDLDLIDGLKQLGVTDVFDMNVSNFDPLEASTDDPLYVGKAQHAARVTVDEEGCEAAAYTVTMVYGTTAMAPPDEEVDFVLDRPFLFAVTGDSGLPLFTGVVNQPNG